MDMPKVKVYLIVIPTPHNDSRNQGQDNNLTSKTAKLKIPKRK